MSISSVSPEQSPSAVPIRCASSTTGTFTMVFLDFDDTLIPSRMYQIFSNYLSIDIFAPFMKSKLSKMQAHVIECIDSIRLQYAKHHDDDIQFCVVSNANQSWLDHMLKGSAVHNIPSHLPILDEYFDKHGIAAMSAKEETCGYLQKRFGEQSETVFENTLNSDKQNQFMWKYTAFALHIASIRRQTGKECTQIISIGDGCDEERAIQKYSETHQVKSLHIRLVKAPTINQIINEWIYLKYNLWTKLNSKYISNDCTRFHVRDLSTIYQSNADNNRYCTGGVHQLPALHQCFELWMNSLASYDSDKTKEIAMKIVCKAIHKRISKLDPESEPRLRLNQVVRHAICKNKEFKQCFKMYMKRKCKAFV
eukprot:208379_1